MKTKKEVVNVFVKIKEKSGGLEDLFSRDTGRRRVTECTDEEIQAIQKTDDLAKLKRYIQKYRLVEQVSQFRFAVDLKGNVYLIRVYLSPSQESKRYIKIPSFVSGIMNIGIDYQEPNQILVVEDYETTMLEHAYREMIISEDEKSWSTYQKEDTELVIEWNGREIQGELCNFCSLATVTRITVKNLNTSKIKEIHNLFTDCKNLRFVDISCFTFESIEDTRRMFNQCGELRRIKFNSIGQAPHLKTTIGMFSRCDKLEALDLSCFSGCTPDDMQDMFMQSGSNIKELDFSGWNTKYVKTLQRLFYGMGKLERLVITDFDVRYSIPLDKILEGVNEKVIIFTGENGQRIMLENHKRLKNKRR